MSDNKTVVVPVEATKAMLDAAERLDWTNEDVRSNCINMWQAMISAAPAATAQQDEREAFKNACAEHGFDYARVDAMSPLAWEAWKWRSSLAAPQDAQERKEIADAAWVAYSKASQDDSTLKNISVHQLRTAIRVTLDASIVGAKDTKERDAFRTELIKNLLKIAESNRNTIGYTCHVAARFIKNEPCGTQQEDQVIKSLADRFAAVPHEMWQAIEVANLLREYITAQPADKPEGKAACQCDLRTALVGDGCSVCNPAMAAEFVEEGKADVWHDAVLAECMKVESCYVKDDPVKTLSNLIDWYAKAEQQSEPVAWTDVEALAGCLADSVLNYPDFDCDNEIEPRPLCSLAKRLLEALATQPAQPQLSDELNQLSFDLCKLVGGNGNGYHHEFTRLELQQRLNAMLSRQSGGGGGIELDSVEFDQSGKLAAADLIVRGVKVRLVTPLQALATQAQELDMGYGPNACPKCGKSQPQLSDEEIERLALDSGFRKSNEHWGDRYYTELGRNLFTFARSLLSRQSGDGFTPQQRYTLGDVLGAILLKNNDLAYEKLRTLLSQDRTAAKRAPTEN